MKTPEDEAFDDLAKRQGAWGGGFPAKRAMAADKHRTMSKKDLAMDSLTRICEIQQRLINQLIALEQNSYFRGYENGMAAQAEVDVALNEIAK